MKRPINRFLPPWLRNFLASRRVKRQRLAAWKKLLAAQENYLFWT